MVDDEDKENENDGSLSERSMSLSPLSKKHGSVKVGEKLTSATVPRGVAKALFPDSETEEETVESDQDSEEWVPPPKAPTKGKGQSSRRASGSSAGKGK